jgi:hypothetical protein
LHRGAAVSARDVEILAEERAAAAKLEGGEQ